MKTNRYAFCISAALLIASNASSFVLAKSDDSEFELGKIENKSHTGPLTNEQVEQLLDKRVPGTMGVPFSQFANMVLVPTKSGQAVTFETTSDKVGKTLLRSPFPEFYHPTLRQFLDEVAWQTKSKWKYDSGEKATSKKLKEHSEVKQLAIFEFTEAERAKPFDFTPAKDWTSTDKGSWTMYSPPGGSPVSLDVYEMGTYSAHDKAVEPELLKKVPQDLSLEWARRVYPKVKLTDFSTVKVGPFDAIFFKATVKSQAKKDVNWRQWVFMDGKQCYFIVSTIFPDMEQKLLPDVEAMLKSFRTKHAT